MTDIFEQKILCNKCDIKMKAGVISRNGLELRAIKCPKCGSTIVHPADLNASERFNNLRGRTFNVKLRMVGNSHAISIPKEILDFMNSMNPMNSANSSNSPHNQIKKHMDDMVKLCLRDFNSLSLNFGNEVGRDTGRENEREIGRERQTKKEFEEVEEA